ncbi:MAG: hypothetical protein QOH63_4146 [Acidobacteriota bacterium]|jgi:hypothetical protein|nr:hypothetical protein [Acidobacteriota bacterium]
MMNDELKSEGLSSIHHSSFIVHHFVIVQPEAAGGHLKGVRLVCACLLRVAN